MSSGFTMVYGSIFDGTLMGKWPAAAVFATILPLADKDGNIDVNPELVAYKTGWPVKELMQGIEQLMQPDPLSRSKDKDGRRLELIDPDRPWGWHVVNHKLYREKSRLAMKNKLYTESGKDAERKRRDRIEAADNASGPIPHERPEPKQGSPGAPHPGDAVASVTPPKTNTHHEDRVKPDYKLQMYFTSNKRPNNEFYKKVRSDFKARGTITKRQAESIMGENGWTNPKLDMFGNNLSV
jgi:hypothetical protein